MGSSEDEKQRKQRQPHINKPDVNHGPDPERVMGAEGSRVLREEVPGQTHLVFPFNKVTRRAY